MIKARKYTAYLMLLTFMVVITPWALVHDAVSNHSTEDDTHCLVFHKNSGVHMEESHGDCPVFEAKALLYAPVKAQPSVQNNYVLTAEYVSCIILSSPQTAPVFFNAARTTVYLIKPLAPLLHYKLLYTTTKC